MNIDDDWDLIQCVCWNWIDSLFRVVVAIARENNLRERCVCYGDRDELNNWIVHFVWLPERQLNWRICCISLIWKRFRDFDRRGGRDDDVRLLLFDILLIERSSLLRRQSDHFSWTALRLIFNVNRETLFRFFHSFLKHIRWISINAHNVLYFSNDDIN